MHVGITYDLRDEYLAEGHGEEATAEFDRAETIDAIATGLLELGHQVDRIGRARQLVNRLAAGDRWDMVFNICEGLKGMAREAQVPAILEVFDIPYTFADPLVMSLCLHKGLAKMVVERAGLPTPKSLLVESPQDLNDLGARRFRCLPNRSARGPARGLRQPRGFPTVLSWRASAHNFWPSSDSPYWWRNSCPAVSSPWVCWVRVPKATVLGTLEIILLRHAEPGVYSYVNKERCEELVEYRLVRPDDREVRQAEQTALAACERVGMPRRWPPRSAVGRGRVSRSSWKPIHWPGCIPRIRTCRCWPRPWASPTSS